MPVQRFRSIEEMNAAPSPERSGSSIDRFLRHCARYRRMSPHTQAPGVYKFRSLEEAQAARERAAAAATPKR